MIFQIYYQQRSIQNDDSDSLALKVFIFLRINPYYRIVGTSPLRYRDIRDI